MSKYLIFIILLVIVIGGLFFYSNGYFPIGNNNKTYKNNEIPISYPDHIFPLYNDVVVNEVIEGEEDSVTISFLSKESKEEIKSYYSDLLKDAYQISVENKKGEYTSYGLKNDYIYSITVTSSKTKYDDKNYNAITTIGVMPMDEDMKKDMENMTEKEKEVMLIWFKAINEMDK